MALKYWLEFTSTNVVNETEVEKIVHRVEILNDDYTGEPVQLYGYCSLVKSSTKDTLEPIRGGGLKIRLEAGLDLTLEDLYSENERTFKVTYTRGEQLEFIGWLSPEGLYRDFVADKWVISLDATDGLGFLSDLSYVENNTKQLFVGKQTLIEVVSNCFKRTNLQQDINIFKTDVFYEGQDGNGITSSTFEHVNVNTYRYISDDNRTPLTCLEVLKAICETFNLSITQHLGEWYIYRPNKLDDINPASRLFNFDYNGIPYDPNFTIFYPLVNIGSSINGFYPYHVGSNQRITIEQPIRALRINYKYGLVRSLFDNIYLESEILPPSTVYTVDEWVINDDTKLSFPPENRGFILESINNGENDIKIITSDKKLVLEGNQITHKGTIKYIFDGWDDLAANRLSTYKVKVMLSGLNGGNPKRYLSKNSEWTQHEHFIEFKSGESKVFTYEIHSEPLPFDGNVYIELYAPENNVTNVDYVSVYDVRECSINSTDDLGDLKGEVHEFDVINSNNTKAAEVREVMHGDSESAIYSGTLFKSDGVTPTTRWSRSVGFPIFQPLLQGTGNDILKMNQRPMRVFKGDVMGYVPYLSVIDIDGIDGRFIPTENYEYDAKENITKLVLKEISNDNIGGLINEGIDYNTYLDYGNVTKPTIR